MPQHVPFIDQMRQELSYNMSERERSISMLAGAGLLGFGLAQPSWRRWVSLLLGIGLLKRGLTGHCDLYHQLHLNMRYPAPPSSVKEKE
jgi:uncharacterized membrane protein